MVIKKENCKEMEKVVENRVEKLESKVGDLHTEMRIMTRELKVMNETLQEFKTLNKKTTDLEKALAVHFEQNKAYIEQIQKLWDFKDSFDDRLKEIEKNDAGQNIIINHWDKAIVALIAGVITWWLNGGGK